MLLRAVQQWYNQSSLVEFYQDENIRAGVKSYMGKIIMRNNTITGRLYRDEPAILAWDIMNEPQFPGDDTGKLLTVSISWLQHHLPNNLLLICMYLTWDLQPPQFLSVLLDAPVQHGAGLIALSLSLLGTAGTFCMLWAVWAPVGSAHASWSASHHARPAHCAILRPAGLD